MTRSTAKKASSSPTKASTEEVQDRESTDTTIKPGYTNDLQVSETEQSTTQDSSAALQAEQQAQNEEETTPTFSTSDDEGPGLTQEEYDAKVAVPEGRILEPDEDFSFDGVEIGNQIIAKEDVYRKVYPGRSRRPSYIQVAHAGSPVADAAPNNIKSANHDGSGDGYEAQTNDELSAELEKRGLPKSGNKDELVARLEEDDKGKE